MRGDVVSSAQTVFVKFVEPLIWLGLTMPGAAMLFGGAFPKVQAMIFPDGVADWMRWPVAAAWLCAGLLMVYAGIGLKRVAIDGDLIRVSNYFSEIELPLASVVGVEETRWLRVNPVTIEFADDTPFGRFVTFMPKARLFWTVLDDPGPEGRGMTSFPRYRWPPHPIVEELRDAAYHAREDARAERLHAQGIRFADPAPGAFARRKAGIS